MTQAGRDAYPCASALALQLAHGFDSAPRLQDIASAPSSVYVHSSTSADVSDVLAALDPVVDAICVEALSACALTSYCHEPPSVAVSGRGLDTGNGAQCRLGTMEFDAEVVNASLVLCNSPSTVDIDDPSLGAQLTVQVSVDGGSYWTRLVSGTSLTIPCVSPMPIPP
eukprot:6184831-Pleurochrysis_carterae.AAC.1